MEIGEMLNIIENSESLTIYDGKFVLSYKKKKSMRNKLQAKLAFLVLLCSYKHQSIVFYNSKV